jgi:hypothetical protein
VAFLVGGYAAAYGKYVVSATFTAVELVVTPIAFQEDDKER